MVPTISRELPDLTINLKGFYKVMTMLYLKKGDMMKPLKRQ
jgi:hypothetical protein